MLFTSTTVQHIRQLFVSLLREEKFIPDRTGASTIEIINASFIADEPAIFGTPNDDWHQRELDWYLSQSLKVADIPPPIPKIWRQIADTDGYINSNYGWMIFSKENHFQFDNVVNTLIKNPDTRQAIMVYNRPSIHFDATFNGRQDFICCQNTQHFIRNGKLLSIANFRSNCAIFGYKGDLAWINWVHNKLYENLLSKYPDLIKGEIIWNAMSLHIYDYHFKLIERFINGSTI